MNPIKPFPTTTYHASRAKVSDGKSVPVTVPAGVEVKANELVYIEGFLGFAMRDVAADATDRELTLQIEQAEYETDQTTDSDVMTRGADLYFDPATKKLTETAAADRPYAGKVTAAKDADKVVWFILAPQNKPATV